MHWISNQTLKQHFHLRRTIALALGCIGLCLACKSDQDVVPKLGDAGLQSLLLEVSYEPGAIPYTGTTLEGEELWDLFRVNIETLLQGTGLELSSPDTLSQMSLTQNFSESDFTTERILEIDDAYRKTQSSQSTLVFHALWLDGYYYDGERKSGVIGVSIGDTGVIAIFKPVVLGLGLTEAGRRFGEQLTLIHEVGHGLGLVNDGLEMQKAHQDVAHGAHCDDENCVMYWANEGPSELVEFVKEFIDSGRTVLFDDNCIADVKGAFND